MVAPHLHSPEGSRKGEVQIPPIRGPSLHLLLWLLPLLEPRPTCRLQPDLFALSFIITQKEIVQPEFCIPESTVEPAQSVRASFTVYPLWLSPVWRPGDLGYCFSSLSNSLPFCLLVCPSTPWFWCDCTGYSVLVFLKSILWTFCELFMGRCSLGSWDHPPFWAVQGQLPVVGGIVINTYNQLFRAYT